MKEPRKSKEGGYRLKNDLNYKCHKKERLWLVKCCHLRSRLMATCWQEMAAWQHGIWKAAFSFRGVGRAGSKAKCYRMLGIECYRRLCQHRKALELLAARPQLPRLKEWLRGTPMHRPWWSLQTRSGRSYMSWLILFTGLGAKHVWNIEPDLINIDELVRLTIPAFPSCPWTFAWRRRNLVWTHTQMMIKELFGWFDPRPVGYPGVVLIQDWVSSKSRVLNMPKLVFMGTTSRPSGTSWRPSLLITSRHAFGLKARIFTTKMEDPAGKSLAENSIQHTRQLAYTLVVDVSDKTGLDAKWKNCLIFGNWESNCLGH